MDDLMKFSQDVKICRHGTGIGEKTALPVGGNGAKFGNQTGLTAVQIGFMHGLKHLCIRLGLRPTERRAPVEYGRSPMMKRLMIFMLSARHLKFWCD